MWYALLVNHACTLLRDMQAKKSKKINTHKELSGCFTPDSKFVKTISEKGNLCVYLAETGKLLSTYQLYKQGFDVEKNDAYFSADGSQVLIDTGHLWCIDLLNKEDFI